MAVEFKQSVKGDLVRGTGQVSIPFLYTPRDYQIENLFAPMERGIRRIGAVWHRRAGKDKSCWNLMIKEAAKEVGVYYYVFPQQNQGRKVLWEGRGKDKIRFLDHVPTAILKDKPHETDMKLNLWNGSLVQIVGTDNIHMLRGTNPRGIVYSEFSYGDPMAWTVFRPVLNENGGWAVFNFTPNSQNHAYELYNKTKDNPRWYWSVLPVDKTNVQWYGQDDKPITIEEMLAEERASGMEEDFLNQEYYCSFTGIMFGSYYGRLLEAAEKEGRVSNGVLYDPRYPVDTAWDIGVRDATSIWFYQRIGRNIYFIDFYESSGESIEHYIKHCYSKKYVYNVNLAPHDIRKRDFTSGKSAYDVADQITGKRSYFTVVPKSEVADGIEMARLIMPRCFFNSEKCKRGLDSLRQYHKTWDETRRTFSLKPYHDWASNAADAFRTFAKGYTDVKEVNQERIWTHPTASSSDGWMKF